MKSSIVKILVKSVGLSNEDVVDNAWESKLKTLKCLNF